MHKANKSTKTKPALLTNLNPECAGIDIGAKELFVSIANNTAKQEVRSFTTFTTDLRQMIDWLKKKRCEKYCNGIHRRLYPSCFKSWNFAKISARDLTSSKQSPIKEIGAMQRGLKIGMLMKGKANF